MGASVSELLSRAYNYLGVPTQDKLNLSLVLPILLDQIDFYLLDGQLSDENWLLKFYTFTPSSKDDDIVTAPAFSNPVLMEIRDSGSTSDSDWRGMLIANASDTQDLARSGIDCVAFYGQGTNSKMRWSFDPVNDRQVEARLWYEPVATAPASLLDSPKLSQAFAAMLSLKTALACVPYVDGIQPDEGMVLAKGLQLQLMQWERKWNLWIYGDKNAVTAQRRDFRGNRRWFRRDTYGGWGW